MSMRTRAGKKISLTNYEELLAVPTIEGASDIPLDQLSRMDTVMMERYGK